MLTWITIEKEAINHNLSEFKKYIGNNVLLMPVVKSNAYGHGLTEIASICNHHPGVGRICTVSLDEALELIPVKPIKPIQILSFYELDTDKIQTALSHLSLTFPVYSLDQLTFLNRIGEKMQQTIPVHLKVDTGTTRVGLLPPEALELAVRTRRYKHIYLEGLWSHLASSEDDAKFTYTQLNRLVGVIKETQKRGVTTPLNHIACTASTILYPETHLNAVRVGLGTYGLYPSDEMRKKINLHPALSLNTKIVHIKEIPKNTSVGYGRSYITRQKSKIAILPVGYFDGYDRLLSNNAEVLIQGVRCPVRGRICMNLTMVEVTKLKKVKVGEKVILIGQDGTRSIPAEDLAARGQTINYEIIARLGKHIPRIVI